MPEELDPMDTAEIAKLRSQIRLLQERLAASGNGGVSPLSEHAQRIVQGDLTLLQKQLDIATDATGSKSQEREASA